ncbi:MAG TPA: endolytic transglycosylase MltG [Candidatus Magasanikbacteria bacterium]|nr:endolytic transglycosylase MltG [Candidatus Magasanikbacteria bacterium]
MSFNNKILVLSIIVLIGIPFAVGIVGYQKYQEKEEAKKNALKPREEINVTIIPGWTLRQVASDWVKKGFLKKESEVYEILGEPARKYGGLGNNAPDLTVKFPEISILKEKEENSSYEGFIFPDTYRVYKDAKPEELLKKIFDNLEQKITAEMRAEMKKQGKSFFEILTMASIVEKEAPDATSMAKVADIFWRRLNMNWALQSCATVNYITGKTTPAVSLEETKIDSPYNTYKYRGLPPGPISNPSLTAIKAVIYPEKNDYWYFLSDNEGNIYYSKTLEQHNAYKARYLK